MNTFAIGDRVAVLSQGSAVGTIIGIESGSRFPYLVKIDAASAPVLRSGVGKGARLAMSYVSAQQIARA